MLRALVALLLAFTLYSLPRAASAESDAERWWSHVRFLAGDALEGRDTGSPGHHKAAEYVAARFAEAGLEPPFGGSYLQQVAFNSRKLAEERSRVELEAGGRIEPLVFGDDIVVNPPAEPVESLAAELVFVGYGLRAPEKSYDDLAGLDLSGRIAVVVSGGPAEVPDPLRAHYQSTAERWRILREAGAIGVITIQNPRTANLPWGRQALTRRRPMMSLTYREFDESAGQRFSAALNPDRADRLLGGTGHTFAEILALADASRPLPRFPLGKSLRLRLATERSRVLSENVAGRLAGADPRLSREYVVVSAHLDHLGVGAPIDGDAVYNGAMDNASGVATLVEVARRLGASAQKPRRSVLVVAVTGEEKGLQGSRYFAARPPIGAGVIVADLNMDMFLPLYPLRLLMSQGLGESDLGDVLRAVAGERGIEIQADPEPDRNRFITSDQYSFIRRGVPSLAFKFGYVKGSPEEKTHKDWLRTRYHAPSDDLAQPVDREGAAQFNQLIAALAARVADRDERPAWKPDSFFRRFAP
jgi:hypothetical protein